MSIAESVQASILSVEKAVQDGSLSPSAADNIRVWLTEERYLQ